MNPDPSGPTNATTLATCSHCSRTNRVPAAAAGAPRCGNCHQPLPWVTEADDDTFKRRVEQATLPVLVDLWAPWCGPCRTVSPVLEQLAVQYAGKLKLVKVNADIAPGLSQRFSIQAIPTLILLHRGDVLARQVGALPAANLRSWLEQAMPRATAPR